MPPEETVTWADLDKRCEGCRRLSEANHTAITATVEMVVQKAMTEAMKRSVPVSILWTNKLESAGAGAVLVAFLALLVYVATH